VDRSRVCTPCKRRHATIEFCRVIQGHTAPSWCASKGQKGQAAGRIPPRTAKRVGKPKKTSLGSWHAEEKAYLGRPICKIFDPQVGYFYGTVEAHDPNEELWMLQYDDGDQEEVEFAEMQRLVAIYEERLGRGEVEGRRSGAKRQRVSQDAVEADAGEGRCEDTTQALPNRCRDSQQISARPQKQERSSEAAAQPPRPEECLAPEESKAREVAAPHEDAAKAEGQQVELSSANAQRELAYSPGKEGLMEVSVVVEKSCDGMVDSMMVDTHFESSTSAQTELAHAVDATDLVAELQSNAS